MRKYIKSLNNALKGLRTVWLEEKNFRLETVLSAIVLVLVFVFQLSIFESSFIIVAIILVLTGEVINTVIEDLCDKVEPQFNEVIGKIKNMAAYFVLISFLGAILIVIFVFINHFLLT